MSLIKLAAQQKKQGGISGWAGRHPLLAGGIALTGGIAAADAGTNLYKHISGGGTWKAALPTVKHGLKEGALYGGILSAAEPAILHGALKKKVENQ